MSEPKKISIVHLGFFLCFICAVAAAALAFAANVTKGPIAKAKEAKVYNGLKTVLPEFDNDLVKTRKIYKSESGIEVEIYTAKKNGKVVGYAAKAGVTTGYGGYVEGLLGLDPAGKITNYVISSHNETPGLGSRATERKVQKTIFNLCEKKDGKGIAPNRILDQFKGHSASADDSWKIRPWKLKKDGGDVDSVTGATISSNAVRGIAWEAASAFAKNKNEILKGN